MALVNYDPSAGGPSQGAAIDQMKGADDMQTVFEQGQTNAKLGQINDQQAMFARPQLASTLGATGQFNSSAAAMARSQQDTDFANQRFDISSQFARTQADMKRQEVFAGLGIMLG